MDDGSTDGTAGIAAGFGDRLRYVHQPHQGLGAALNRGIEESRGELISFLDSDDIAFRPGSEPP